MTDRKIVHYYTVFNEGLSQFDEEINIKLTLEYHLYGNPYVVYEKNHSGLERSALAQAMVKYEEKE